ncbi:type II toxin-antitoxin system VapC family toxin [Microbacterium sp.]|uniref:type II toxin-antitoxin system VapC family toxin n=1 Tax=Microbacterium sp. TaxID=51671 RepID=UPI0039E5B771
MKVYLDASAAAKLMTMEAESLALRTCLAESSDGGDSVWSSVLLETELRRMAQRNGHTQAEATTVLDALSLGLADRALFVEAGLLPGDARRSLDALHVATALRLSADLFISYESRQLAAARDAGLHVASPS